MAVEIIAANGKFSNSNSKVKKQRLRVAAYCRVSTDDEEQIKSYNSMVSYYTDLIKSSADWIFAGVYADEAITGTKVDKREQFQQLINDCMAGKIDMVITKSIPRFARNTLDTLKYVRLLRERQIAVFFEVEKINTLTDGEFLITILSSVAQQEVENTSAYVKKGLKMKMKRGEMVGFQDCLGYDYDSETKTLSINEEQAEVVKYIFSRYLAGAGGTIIANELNQQGIKTIRGNQWRCNTIMGIIKNEKYKGDLLLGKSITLDPISKRRVKNLGEEEKYYVREHHEPIVSPEVFDKAQEILNKRNSSFKRAEPNQRKKYSRQYAFSSLISCGFCDSTACRQSWHGGDPKYKKIVWKCQQAAKQGQRTCPESKAISEKIIEDAFVDSYKMLYAEDSSVVEEFLKRVEETLGEDSSKEKLKKARQSRDNIFTRRKRLLDGYLEKTIAADIYKKKDFDLEQKLAKIQEQIEELEDKVKGDDDLRERVEEFRKSLSSDIVMDRFDREVFESMVDRIILGGYDSEGNPDPYRLTFVYKTGFRKTIDNSKRRYKAATHPGLSKKSSNTTDEVGEMSSNASLDT